jgi:hypothetical protein
VMHYWRRQVNALLIPLAVGRVMHYLFCNHLT